MKTILLIDDDAQLRTMFALALQRTGYHVIEADSGVTGLAAARLHLPDLILSDINMPGGDGSTLLRDIRLDPELKDKQVVLMTGRPDLLTPRKGMEDGADDFLIKPVSLEGLRNSIAARFERISINWRVENQILAKLRSSLPPQLPHEVFTPLAGIIGMMELLTAGSSEFSPEELQDFHLDVYQSALRLHRTLRNYLLILDFQNARAETAPALPPAALQETIQAGVAEALRTNGKRSGDITVQVDPCSVAIKPVDLSQIVEELVDNACKFSRQGTSIQVAMAKDGRLVVSDQGRGMTAEEIKSIGAFNQFDRKKNEQQGLGLGLFLVQKLAGQCQARLSITGEPGKGTQVQIEFPPTAPANSA